MPELQPLIFIFNSERGGGKEREREKERYEREDRGEVGETHLKWGSKLNFNHLEGADLT